MFNKLKSLLAYRTTKVKVFNKGIFVGVKIFVYTVIKSIVLLYF